MPKLKLALDTNVVVDFLNKREPFFEGARKLMICGRMGEFELCVTSSQFTDLVYILSDGGQKARIPKTLERLRGLRSFVDVIQVGAEEIDAMLASSWADPEDFLIHETALRERADALVTRDASDFQASVLPVFDCDGLFDWISGEFGIDYEEIDW